MTEDEIRRQIEHCTLYCRRVVLASDYDAKERECEELRARVALLTGEIQSIEDGTGIANIVAQYEAQLKVERADRDKLAASCKKWQRDFELVNDERAKLAAKVERVKALTHYHSDYVPTLALTRALADEETRVERRNGERRGGHEHLYDAGNHIRYCEVGIRSGPQKRTGRDRRGAR